MFLEFIHYLLISEKIVMLQVLKVELETMRLKEKSRISQIKALHEENRSLRQASVKIVSEN